MPSKEVKDLIRSLRKQGWTVEQTRNNHWKATAPTGGQPEYIASTPSDHRSLKNTVARLKRLGYDPLK